MRIFLAGLFCVATMARGESITVSAAISLRDALTKIVADYTQQTGEQVEVQFGASGRLAEQIKRGAPVDAFISAANKQVDQLIADGAVDGRTVRIVAGNSLVLVASADAQHPPESFEQIADARFTRIAIGEPRTVPAGEYAMQVLENLKLAEPLKGRLVYGASVRQVLDYVQRSEADAGIVYKTDAQHAGDKVKVVVTADPSLHAPIQYPAVIVTKAAHRDAAEKFLNYLMTEPARQVFAEHGFVPPEP